MTKLLDNGARGRRAVYDGQQRLGGIQQSDDGYVVRDRQGRTIGTFDTAHEAIDAVLKAGGVGQNFALARSFYVEPLLAFVARAEARAMLFAAGELDLHGAVDGLQSAAERDGLVDHIGQHAVQEIVAAAFREHGE